MRQGNNGRLGVLYPDCGRGEDMNNIADSYISHNGDNLWDFEIISDVKYENVNRIHPLKQKDVCRLIQDVQKDSHIIGIIVFGSAVRFDCHSRSDLDVLIIRDDSQIRIDASLSEVQSELDIIFHSKLGERLKEEIRKTGVIVFRR